MISKRAALFNIFLKYAVKPLQAHGLIPPFIMRLIYVITHKLSLFLPIPKFIRIVSINNTQTKGEWIDIKRQTNQHKVIYYLHGGGYFFGSPRTHRNITWRLSKQLKVGVFSLRYRMAPKHTVPTSVSDAIEGYRWLLAQGYSGEDIIIGGDSAGGSLTLLTIQKILALKLPTPKAAFCLSPLTDMASEGDSMTNNASHSRFNYQGFPNVHSANH